MSYLAWLVFFAIWLAGLRLATRRAFPQPIFQPDPGTAQGPVYIPSLFFHGSLVLALTGILIAVLVEDVRATWLAVPGSAAPIFIGCFIECQFIVERKDNPLHLSPYWLDGQWPFLLPSLALAGMGVFWSIRSESFFPLLFVFYSGFFLFQFWFFYSHCNGVTLSHQTLETSANFPRLHEVTTRSRRPRSLHLTVQEIQRWHRTRLWSVRITRDGEEPIEMVSRITPTQHIRIEVEFAQNE
jgi:hypothetical protein